MLPPEPATLALLARPLLTLAGFVVPHARRLHAERLAGRDTSSVPPEPLAITRGFRPTLARLRSRSIDDKWWRSLLNRVGHEYIAPDFLRSDQLRVWLEGDTDSEALLTLAAEELLPGNNTDLQRARLRATFHAVTGEPAADADGPIDVLVAVLLSGYLSELSPGEQRIVELFSAQEARRQPDAHLLRVLAERTSNDDRFLAQAHTAEARKLLASAKRRVAFEPATVCEDIDNLAARIDSGDLGRAESSLLHEVLLYAARLNASALETVDRAKNHLRRLRVLRPTADTRIVDALVLSTTGDIAGALRLLQDLDDSDARATVLAILATGRGSDAALEWLDQQQHTGPSLLTPGGWRNAALLLAGRGRWREAARVLAAACPAADDRADLAYLEALANIAQLLPVEYRAEILDYPHPPLRQGPHTLEGSAFDTLRTVALARLTRTIELLGADSLNAKLSAEQWKVWLLLSSPDSFSRDLGRKELLRRLAHENEAARFVPLTYIFSIDFDRELLWRFLQRRRGLGEFEPHEELALYLLAEKVLDPHARLELFEGSDAKKSTMLPPALRVLKVFECLLLTKQVARARALLDEHSELLGNDATRARASLADLEGDDPHDALERLFAETDTLCDLENLIRHLAERKNWGRLRPLLALAFERKPTLLNAKRLVDCMFRCPDASSLSHSILAFLEVNTDLVDRDTFLQAAMARALFREGRLAESQKIVDRHLGSGFDEDAIQLDIDISVQSGDWERFPTIARREWERRDLHSPMMLLQLAALASEHRELSAIAYDFTAQAATAAHDDPHVLTKAVGLAFSLDREGTESHSWLRRAQELSTEVGPVWSVRLRTLIEELLPSRRQQAEHIQALLAKGEIPIHLAGAVAAVPLTELLLARSQENAQLHDGRQRLLIPIASGVRQSVPVKPGRAVAFDFSAILVLASLGLPLLEAALAAFDRVLLHPDTLVLLLNERNYLQPQPSQLRAADEIQCLLDAEVLRLVDTLSEPPRSLTLQAGRDLAQLLHLARERGGYVIHPLPVLSPSSMLEVEADLGDYRSLVVSPADFLEQVFHAGYLTRPCLDAALGFLGRALDTSGKTQSTAVLSEIFYVESSGLRLLQAAGALASLSPAGLVLRCHPCVPREVLAWRSSRQRFYRLSVEVDAIRQVLRSGLKSGMVTFLPRRGSHGQELADIPASARLLQDLFAAEEIDAVVVADRHCTRYVVGSRPSARSLQIVSIPEVLSYLYGRLEPHLPGLYDQRSELRARGFAFLGVEPAELRSLLGAANYSPESGLQETAELRTLRQYLARVRASEMVQLPTEEPFMEQLFVTSIVAIASLWSDSDLPPDRVVKMADWIWDYVVPHPSDWLPARSATTAAESMAALHLSKLLRLAPADDFRKDAFNKWVEERILSPLSSSNDCVIRTAADLVGQDITTWSREIARTWDDDSDRGDASSTPASFNSAAT